MADLRTLLEQAVARHRAGQLGEAAAGYREVLQLHPDQPDALHLLGLLCHQQGQPAEAAELLGRAIAARPQVPAYHLARAVALRAAGNPNAAIAEFRETIRLDPGVAEAHHQLGNALKAAGRFPEATASLREAARRAPENPIIWLNLGVARLEVDDFEEAIEAFRRAVALQPAHAEAQNVLGHALLTHGRTTDALAHFAEALRLRPDYAAAHNNLARALKAQGRLSEAVAHYREALRLAPDAEVHSNLLYALNYLDDLAPETVAAEHRAWAARYAPPAATDATPRAAPAPGRRLRVGYVSPDFVNHAVAFFFEPVLHADVRTRFEIFCYSNAAVPDRVTERLRATAEHWRDIARQPDDAVARQIREDGIDVLVDLAGHTAHHRLLVFARRPAPLQLTWLGYPNTTGMDAIDYRITDAVSDPPGQTDAWHAEKLLRLPRNFSCYLPPPASPPVAPPPVLAAGTATFGCFNNFAKVTPAAIRLWARVLQAVPGSRLLLKSRGLADAGTIARIQGEFGLHGIAPDRIELNGSMLSVADHLQCYAGVDVALDTFPYNGATTTCEALWMGVPVVTLAGRTHVARVGASLLTHLGSPDWIAASPDDYLRIAAALAGDPNRLASLRAGLRERLRASPLCDAQRFTRDLEAALVTLASPAPSV